MNGGRITAVGSDAHSKFAYVKAKGETERDIIALGFEHTHIFRPSMLLGAREEKRALERVLIRVWSFLNPILMGGWLGKYRGIDGKDVAGAMYLAAQKQVMKVRVYQWGEMNALLREVGRVHEI